MEKIVKLQTPLRADVIKTLHAADSVRISGPVYSARDAAHKRLCRLLDTGQKLPFELKGQVIYFVGPTPTPPGRVIGSAGPTTSSRMDAFSPAFIAQGLAATIGKGYRSRQVIDALVRYGAVHFSATGGAAALLSEHIVSAELVAYPELGTEAIYRLEFLDFPAIVAYDSYGNSVYGNGR